MVISDLTVYCDYPDKATGKHEVLANVKDVVFLLGEDSISCVSSDKEVMWETTFDELDDFLDDYFMDQK